MPRRPAPRPTYELRIGELVLEGLPPGAHRAVVAALERELGRLLAADTAPFAGRVPDQIRVDRLDAGDVTLAPDASPGALGVAAARAIVRQLGTLSGRSPGKGRP